MLSGYKTIILGALYIALSTFTGLTGWTIPGFQPDPNWLQHDIIAAMGVAAKVGLSGTMQFGLKMVLDSMAPKIAEAVKAAVNAPGK